MKERNAMKNVEITKDPVNGVGAKVYVAPRRLVGMTLAMGAMVKLGAQQSMNVLKNQVFHAHLIWKQ